MYVRTHEAWICNACAGGVLSILQSVREGYSFNHRTHLDKVWGKKIPSQIHESVRGRDVAGFSSLEEKVKCGKSVFI